MSPTPDTKEPRGDVRDGRDGRLRRALLAAGAAATAVAVAATLIEVLPDLPDWFTDDSVPESQGMPDTVTGTTGEVEPRELSEELAEASSGDPDASWPTDAAETVPVSDAADPEAMTSVGGLPVQAVSAEGGGSAEVEVLDLGAAREAGVDGLLLRVEAAEELELHVDPSDFADAYGGSYGERLTLVQLPDCFVSDPQDPECRTPVESEPVTGASGTVAALFDPEQGTPAPADEARAPAAPGTAAPPASAPAEPGTVSTGVFALTASASSSGGDYSATPLEPSSEWSVSASSGVFSWSYPLEPVPVPSSLMPHLALDYSSQTVDGRTSATNNQGSWIGEGFSYEPGYIERSYKACADDGHEYKGDQCWGTDNATLMLNGASGSLVKDDDTGEWHLESDDGSKVEHLTGAENGDDDGEYWRVTTTDGTRYYFGRHRLPGWSSGDETTDSTWTVPVFGDDDGEPCHDDSFADSWCQQGWRWNLDYVEDPRGNVMTYFYGKETNHYALDADTGTDGTPYTRGGYLKRVDYGQREGEVYDGDAPARVVFDTTERCLPDDDFDCAPEELDEDTAEHWPDVPYDRFCEQGTECGFSQSAPSFWTRKRLEEIRTQYSTGDGYETVDSWKLDHLFTDNGDGSRTLWLSEITRTGHDGDETESLPPVQLDGIQLPNRVDGPDDNIQPLVRFRLAAVYTETGGQIDVNYSGGDCDPGDLPEEGEQTGRCYPVKWSPPGEEEPITDWFHKYVVEEVIESDRTGGSPDQVTRYEYVGDAGWRHDEPNGITDEKYQTWGQWRGYETVRVRTGDGQDMPTRTDYTFLRGLHGGEEPGGGTASVKVTDSTGGEYTDHDELAGHQLEEVVYDGDEIVAKSVSEPWRHVSATRTEDWGTSRAAFTNTGVERGFTALADGGWRETKTTTTFDTDTGRSERVEDLGDVSTDGDDMCTRTTYADNEGAHVYVHIARVESVSVACSEEAGPGDLVSDVRRHYDGGGYGDEPVKGDVTLTEEFDGRDGDGAPVYTTVREAAYDEYGQQVEVTDAEGQVNETVEYSYDNGLITGFTVTNALGHTVENHVDPARGIVHAEIDANDRRTDTAYDPLGRLTEVWLPDRPKSNDMTPNMKFGYSITENAPAAVSTSTILNDGSYETSYEIYDGFLRPRQTQAPGPDGGRLVSDTFHNGIGRVAKTNDTYYASDEPSGDLLEVRNGDVQGQTVYIYDGAERLTDTVQRVSGDEVWRTSAVHDGDRVHVTPPEGGVPTTVVTDARGRKVEQRQYTGGTPEGDHVSTSYTYTPRGEIATMTTPSGDEWSYEYDHRGRQVAVTDPDTGTTTSVYDDLDQLVSTTDASGATVSYVYDELGRRVESWEGEPGSGTKLTSHEYDTVLKGQLFIQTRHTPEGDFRIGIVGQDRLDRPTNILYRIPESQGELAGDYEFSISYNIDGTVQGMGLPAAGGLPAESTTIGYDDIGRPTSLSGDGSYVTRTEYNQLGQVLQTELAAGSGPKAWITNEYEKGTQRLLGTRVDRQGGEAPLMDTGYTYDDAGNVRAITDAPEGGATETQCFTYDPLLQLTEAWTLPHEDTDACAEEPAAASVGGPAAYWHSYTYDDAGNRVSETLHDTTGSGDDAVRDYTYPDAGQGQPNTVREVVEQTPQGDTLSSFDYDDAGNTVVREQAGERQELEWTAEGRLDTVTNDVGETAYTYTADGERLVRSTPYEEVLYLPGMEVRADRFTGEVKATRYYEHAGQTVAVRTPDSLDLLAADHQGTGQVSMNADSEQSVRRYLTPFGEDRGGDGWAWPDDKGFLGKTVDTSTGLTLVGAREYDPALGRFLSADPIADSSDPLQLNGYAYANNSPLTYSDPTGLWLSSAWNSVKSGASKVGSAVKSGYNSAKNWASENKSTIVSVGAGIAVGAGCTALTAGAGAIGCAALGGAVSGLVQYGMDTPRNDWSFTGAATSTVVGGALGAAGGAIGGRIAGAVGSRVSSWVGGAGSSGVRSGAASTVRSAVKPRTPQPPPPPKPPRPTPTASTPRPAPTLSAPTNAGRGSCNSFVPGTGVVMADGSTKAIEAVEVGEKVLATDPETGEQGARTVVATIDGEGARTLVQIRVDATTEQEAPPEGESAGAESASEVPGPVAVGDVVTATEGHPFWVPELDAWVDAIDLAPGMWLQTSSGTWVQVSAVEVDTQPATVHNLTVEGLHTYHVVAGDLDLLNHNCGGSIDPKLVRFSQDSVSPRFGSGETIEQTAAALRSGYLKPSELPTVRLTARNGDLYTLDNRRLVAFQKSGVPMPFRMATPQEAASEAWKFTTQNRGRSILVRYFDNPTEWMP
ncbi:RHS repeat-associated core domain-containing protein [Nocardiopsis sp. YSL2]|uniref:RHS repeat-associated core domain-containing protein n=1 Tax=Nocardiopsis sp. YSL2 TaxID=2939492 RepID=UPI0026F4480C|nr:RHS repeat-associated core domain-containing protein [Nocardiopsis sp. YSL2]